MGIHDIWNARVTVFNPQDSTIFIGDVSEGDLWFFPTGYPHSIQGLGPDGCEFLLVFDEGLFSEYTTFLLSGWLAHTPSKMISQNFNIPEALTERPSRAGTVYFPWDGSRATGERPEGRWRRCRGFED